MIIDIVSQKPLRKFESDILSSCLKLAGIKNSEVRMHSLDVSSLWTYKQKGHLTDEGHRLRKRWYPRLKDANMVVLLGDVPFELLSDQHDLRVRRGSVYQNPYFGVPIMGTHAPVGVLNENYLFRYFIQSDLEKARDTMLGKRKALKRNMKLNPTLAETIAWFDRFKDVKIFGADIEGTATREVSCIGFAASPTEGICVPVLQYSEQDEINFWKFISERLLENPDITLVWQNGSFDLSVLLQKNGILPMHQMEDTLIASSILWPDFPKSLAFLCSIHTDEPYYKDEGKNWRVVGDWNVYWAYNIKDACTTLEIWQVLEPLLREQGYWELYRRTIDIHEPLLFMQYRGMNTSKSGIEETKIEIQKKIDSIQIKLDAYIEKRGEEKGFSLEKVVTDKYSKTEGYLNVNSPAKMCAYFYDTLKIPSYKNDGKPTCNDKALQRLAKGTENRPPLIEASIAQELITLKKFRGTYLMMDLDDDNRFRAAYNPRGTKTGRFSSQKTWFETGTNMQNLDPAFRGFLKADPGYVLVELDKAKAEWVMVAYEANDANMIEVITTGQDAHAATAKLGTNVPIDIIKLEDDFLGHVTNPAEIAENRELFINQNPEFRSAYDNAVFVPRTMTIRQAGKKSNHGYNYNMKAGRFALENEISLLEAQDSYDGYHRAYPRLHEWYKEIEAQLKENRTLVNCFGRKMRFLKKLDHNTLSAAYNFKPQSTVADIFIDAIIKSYRSRTPAMKKLELLGQVHDSVLFQYPISDLPLFADALIEIREYLEPLLLVNGHEFIIETDLAVGLNWRHLGKYTFHRDKEALVEELKKVKSDFYPEES
jgi:DNA polymerase-1